LLTAFGFLTTPVVSLSLPSKEFGVLEAPL